VPLSLCLYRLLQLGYTEAAVCGTSREQAGKKISPNSDSNSDSGKGPSSEDGDVTCRLHSGQTTRTDVIELSSSAAAAVARSRQQQLVSVRQMVPVDMPSAGSGYCLLP